MPSTVFIYYKVGAPYLEDARVAALALIEAVERQTGVQGKLMQRADDALTWMEVYPGSGNTSTLQATIDAALPASGLGNFVAGVRHTEVFVDLVPPRCA